MRFVLFCEFGSAVSYTFLLDCTTLFVLFGDIVDKSKKVINLYMKQVIVEEESCLSHAVCSQKTQHNIGSDHSLGAYSNTKSAVILYFGHISASRFCLTRFLL